MKERKDLIDDALHATKAAAEEGIVPGGGVAFLRAIEAVENAKRKAKGDEKIGFDIVAERSAFARPADRRQRRRRRRSHRRRRSWRTRTPATATTPRPASTATCSRLGIIDPTKVARTALLNAASVSGLALTTDVLITELKEKKGEESTPAPARCCQPRFYYLGVTRIREGGHRVSFASSCRLMR